MASHARGLCLPCKTNMAPWVYMPGHTPIMGAAAGNNAKAAKTKGKNQMAQAQAQAKAQTPAQAIKATVAAQVGTTLTQADMVAAAHAMHGHGPLHTAYHAGNCTLPGGKSACISKTQVPQCAGNLVSAFLAKYPGATVKPTGAATTWGTKGKPTGKRATIVAAILAGGSLANIVAVGKANQAGFSGLADVVVAGWQGVVTFSHK